MDAPKRIGQLTDGDCFFYTDADEYRRREVLVESINDFRTEIGQQLLTMAEAAAIIRASASGYVVYAIVRATGERCTIRLSDGKRHIWYDADVPVQYTPNRAAFDARLLQMRKDRKQLEEEQTRMQKHRSKKQNKSTEISERTLRMGA